MRLVHARGAQPIPSVKLITRINSTETVIVTNERSRILRYTKMEAIMRRTGVDISTINPRKRT